MVNLLLADGFEEIEALSVVDILRRGDISVNTVAIKNDNLVIGRSGIKVIADKKLSEIDFDTGKMIILPGGMPGVSNLEANGHVQKIIKNYVNEKKWIAAICAAPSILGKAGYLKGIRATCYPGFEKFLNEAIIVDQKVIVDKNFITSKAAGTAIDFALEILKQIKDEKLNIEIKQSICF